MDLTLPTDTLPKIEFFQFVKIFKQTSTTYEKGAVLAFFDSRIKAAPVRLLIKRTNNAYIYVAYSIDEINNTLSALISVFLIGIPLIILISVAGGVSLAKMSLKTIEDITRTADEITASN